MARTTDGAGLKAVAARRRSRTNTPSPATASTGRGTSSPSSSTATPPISPTRTPKTPTPVASTFVGIGRSSVTVPSAVTCTVATTTQTSSREHTSSATPTRRSECYWLVGTRSGDPQTRTTKVFKYRKLLSNHLTYRNVSASSATCVILSMFAMLSLGTNPFLFVTLAVFVSRDGSVMFFVWSLKP